MDDIQRCPSNNRWKKNDFFILFFTNNIHLARIEDVEVNSGAVFQLHGYLGMHVIVPFLAGLEKYFQSVLYQFWFIYCNGDRENGSALWIQSYLGIVFYFSRKQFFKIDIDKEPDNGCFVKGWG